MILLGAHYLPFVFLYGMRMFAVLTAFLLGGGIIIAMYLSATFSIGAWYTGIVLLLFAVVGKLLVDNEAKEAPSNRRLPQRRLNCQTHSLREVFPVSFRSGTPFLARRSNHLFQDSAFCVTLNVDRERFPRPQPSLRVFAMDILIIEDDAVIGKAVQKGLTEAGHECEWIKDGTEGLQAAKSHKHDVIILDLLIPGEPGLSVLEKVRKDGIKTPVLVLTASARWMIASSGSRKGLTITCSSRST